MGVCVAAQSPWILNVVSIVRVRVFYPCHSFSPSCACFQVNSFRIPAFYALLWYSSPLRVVVGLWRTFGSYMSEIIYTKPIF